MKRQIFALATSVLALAAAAQADTIRVAGNFATDHSSSVAMETFAEKLAELSGGEFDVNLFPARQLGGAAENVQAVKLGAVEIIWVGTAYLTRTVPELEIVGLPFQFETREDAFAVVDGPVGDALDEKLAAQDIMSLGYMELGFRQLTNSVRPIETLEDIAGLKIRLQPKRRTLPPSARWGRTRWRWT
jgi:TRAP-type C4-dicarboxylate transport system substrate-binding protein